MYYEKIYLQPGNENCYLETYVADKVTGFTRESILVIPGGGYGSVCSEREGEPIALAFLPYGFNAFVLHYSVASDKKTFPAQLIEASLAIKHIKDNAEKYGINPERVFACGFSAGGHLCASLGTMWHKDEIYKETDMPYAYNKPTGVMLIYPVVSAKHTEGSFKNLLGEKYEIEKDRNESSIENNVDENHHLHSFCIPHTTRM